MKRLISLVPLPFAFVGSIACSSTPEATAPDGDACLTGQAPPGQYCPPPASVTPVPTATATATTPVPATASTAATALPPAAAMAATPVMQGLALQEAKGMTQEGGPFVGQFQEGQVLEQPITIAPNKCYTVIGLGIGVQELDLQLVATPTPGVPPILLTQDSTTGPQAVLGGKASGCWKSPVPIGGAGKILMKATKGAGIAAAQVYSK